MSALRLPTTQKRGQVGRRGASASLAKREFGVLRVRVLGRIEVSNEFGPVATGDELPRRARQVLGVLAARHDRVQSKDALADAVWGEELPRNSGAALEHYVSVLRRRLEPGVAPSRSFLATRAGGYVFDSARARLDLAELRAALRRSEDVPGGDRARIEALGEAAALAGDELPFGEDQYADWAVAVRDEIRTDVLQVLLELAENVLHSDPRRSLGLAKQALARDPILEQPYRIAILSCAALGRREEGLRWYERCVDVLAAELGLEPDARTESARARLLSPEGGGTRRPEAVPGPTSASARPRRKPESGRPRLHLVGGSTSDGGPRSGKPAAGGAFTGGAFTGGAFTGAAISGTSASPGAASHVARPTRLGPHVPFVGRSAELAVLLGDGADLRVVHLVGPAGSGKSALLAEAARRAPERVLLSRCYRTPLPWRASPLQQILARLTGGAEPAHSVRGEAAPKGLDAQDADRLLVELSRVPRPLLVIDEAAAIDAEAVGELLWLLDRCPDLRLVLAHRSPSTVPGTALADLGADVVLRPAPLSREELERADLGAYVDASGGIPALVTAAIRPAPVAGAMALQLARQRTAVLPPPAWELLRLTAALERLSVPEMARITGLEPAELLPSVDALLHAHLLVEDDRGHLRHRSALVRAAVAEQISAATAAHWRSVRGERGRLSLVHPDR